MCIRDSFGRLAESGLTPYDLVNMGHLALIQGSSREAASHYISALEKGELSTEAFINIFNDDANLLTAAGVSADDLPIVLDYVLMSLKKDQ